MKRILGALFCLLLSISARAQFVPITDANFVSWLNANGFSSALSGNLLDTTNALIRNQQNLTITYSSIQNLNGLQYFKSLAKLSLANNRRLKNVPSSLGNSFHYLYVYFSDSISLNLSNYPNIDTVKIQLSVISLGPSNFTLSSACNISLGNAPLLNLKCLFLGGVPLSNSVNLPINITNLSIWNSFVANLNPLPVGIDELWLMSCINLAQADYSVCTNLQTLRISSPSQAFPIYNFPSQLKNLELSGFKPMKIMGSMPPIPNTIVTLTLDNDSLTQLPTIPKSVQGLSINYNFFTTLPALPDSLYSFSCNYNSDTIKNLDLSYLPKLELVGLGNSNLQKSITLPLDLFRIWLPNNKIDSVLFNHSSISAKSTVAPYYLSNEFNFSKNRIVYVDTFGLKANVLKQGYSGYFELNLSNNLLDTFIFWRGSNFRSTILNLSNNKLTYFSLLNPAFVNEINVSNNLLTALTVPNVWQNNYFNHIYCNYNQLTTIPLGLCKYTMYLHADHNNLQYLPAGPNSTIYSKLIINDNPNLGCLPKLGILDSLNITNTNIACLPNYGTINHSNPALSSIPLCTYSFNPNTCPLYSNVTGTIYVDQTLPNCTQNTNDPAVAYQGVKVLSMGNILKSKFYSNKSGLYDVCLQPGNYTVELDTLDSYYTTSCPVGGSYSVVSGTSSALTGNDFALHCKPGFDLGTLGANAQKEFFPGEDNIINFFSGVLSSLNGFSCNTANLAGSISIQFAGPITYQGMQPGALAPTTVGANTLTWNIANFGTLNMSTDFAIKFHTMAVAQSGDQIRFTITVLPTANDNNPSNNIFNQCFTVVNSHDPNYKEVSPTSIKNAPYTDWLNYTVHFQNTGTAPAHNIQLKDTLDPSIDINSFQFITASHNCSASIDSNGIATFFFFDIMLADSISNEPQSHGWVKYRVKLKDSLPSEIDIKNTASIYFDFNPAVVTNTTTLVNCSPKFKNSHVTWCKPTYNLHGKILTSSGTYQDTTVSYRGCDSFVTLNLEFRQSPSTYLLPKQICQGDVYNFNGKYLTQAGNYTDTSVNYYGCDSFVYLTLTVAPIDTTIQRIGDTLIANQNFGSQIWIDCNNNLIASNGNIFVPQYSGMYALVVMNKNCIDTSDCYTIILKSDFVNTIGKNEWVKIFPNPTAGNLLINSSNGLIQSIRVFDSKAAIIKTVTNVDNSKSSIDLSDYPPGLYLLEIKTGDKIARVKVIKE
jgi:uncharacterized repeat protein (TIGR01451 family)